MASFPARRTNKPSGSDYAAYTSSPGHQIARKATKRIVRKESRWQRMKDLPETILLNLQMDAQLLEFGALGWPIGIGLNALHFLVKLSAITATFRPSTLWFSLRASRTLTHADERLQELQQEQASGSSISRILTYFSLALVIISCLNALYLFTRRRSYRLHHKKEPVASKNVRLVPADLSVSKESWAHYLWTSFTAIFRKSQKIDPQMIQQLDVWTPEDLYLHIFALYPPPIAFMWHLINSSNWYIMLVAMGLSVFQSNFVMSAFNNLLKDRAIVSAEVMHEYDKTFVYPRIFRPTRDIGTMTNEAEMIDWRPPRPGQSYRYSLSQAGNRSRDCDESFEYENSAHFYPQQTLPQSSSKHQLNGYSHRDEEQQEARKLPGRARRSVARPY